MAPVCAKVKGLVPATVCPPAATVTMATEYSIFGVRRADPFWTDLN